MTIPSFSPGVNPEYPYRVPHSWPTDETPAIKPYVQVMPKTLRPVRKLSLQYILTRDQKDYVLAFFSALRGPSGIFYWTPIDPVPPPLAAAPGLAAVTVTGSPGSSRDYLAAITWSADDLGLETTPGPTGAITVVSGKVLQVTAPDVIPTGADHMKIYAGTASPGILYFQASIPIRVWTEPITGLLTLTPTPPALNTLRGPVAWTLAGDVIPELIRPGRYSMSLDFEEALVVI